MYTMAVSTVLRHHNHACITTIATVMPWKCINNLTKNLILDLSDFRFFSDFQIFSELQTQGSDFSEHQILDQTFSDVQIFCQVADVATSTTPPSPPTSSHHHHHHVMPPVVLVQAKTCWKHTKCCWAAPIRSRLESSVINFDIDSCGEVYST